MLLSAAPGLALADVTAPFEVICNASGHDCGAVLQQNRRAVAYYSYLMSQHEKNYSTGAVGYREGSASLAMLP